MMADRRTFLREIFKGAGLSTIGGAVWSGFIERSAADPLVLRPPGAVPEEEFPAKCIKCGRCVENCPFGTLRLAGPGDRAAIGTPHFTARSVPCYMCRDIPCVPVCPSGALDKSLVSDKDDSGGQRLDINKAKMGLAVIDRENCIACWGIQCDACHRACPLIDKAIVLNMSRNERTGRHAFMAPEVKAEHCTGCGVCERVCITEKASIFVLPRKIAMGKAQDRYIRGWKAEDEKRLEGLGTDVRTNTPRSSKSAVDYLNNAD